jgi:riboflavin kinase/FMN adenylyltransferase
VAISIGNFDGVHLGHRELLRSARQVVGPSGSVVAISFEPHPLTVLRPAVVPDRLCRFDEREERLRAAGADRVVAIEPSPALLGAAPEDFVARLVDEFSPRYVIEGPDFRFGRDRSGSVRTLRSLERAHGFETLVIGQVETALASQQIVRTSSTMIRWLLRRGRVADAGRLLGRPFALSGTVIAGDRRGRTIGVPTANLDHGELVLPGNGVYSGVAERDGRRFPAAVNVGPRPTFDANAPRCEVHLIGYEGPVDDYGWTLRVELCAWLRDQLRFAGPGPMRAQLARDIASADANARPLVEATA